MFVLKQVKIGIAVPVILVATAIWSYVAIHGLLWGLDKTRGWYPEIGDFFSRHPTFSKSLAGICLIAVAIPLLPLVLAGLIAWSTQFVAWQITSGLGALAICAVVFWLIGVPLLLWTRSWAPDWATRRQWAILRTWKRQIVLLGYAGGYGGPIALGCVGLSALCRLMNLFD